MFIFPLVEPELTDDRNMDNTATANTELETVSSEIVMETTPSVDSAIETDQEDISPVSGKMPVVEIQDSLEESRVGMVVDEQEAGLSGLPVEWRGATMVRQKTS